MAPRLRTPQPQTISVLPAFRRPRRIPRAVGIACLIQRRNQMKLNNLTKIVCMLAVTATSGASLAGAAASVPACACASEAGDWNFHSEASQLLKEIRSSAYRLTDNAQNLKAFPGGVSWETHANELML